MTSRKTVWPPPVVEAKFAAGETVRMSFSQFVGKPPDRERARRLVCQAIGNERQFKQRRETAQRWRPAAPASDLVSLDIYRDGELVTDMAAQTKPKGMTLKQALARIAELEASINAMVAAV